jgi:hypothetical protein
VYISRLGAQRMNNKLNPFATNYPLDTFYELKVLYLFNGSVEAATLSLQKVRTITPFTNESRQHRFVRFAKTCVVSMEISQGQQKGVVVFTPKG